MLIFLPWRLTFRLIRELLGRNVRRKEVRKYTSFAPLVRFALEGAHADRGFPVLCLIMMSIS